MLLGLPMILEISCAGAAYKNVGCCTAVTGNAEVLHLASLHSSSWPRDMMYLLVTISFMRVS